MHDDFYQMYLEEMGNITPCTVEEKSVLLKEAGAGRKEAKKRLVEGHLGIALEYAREYQDKGVLLTDLIQEANMALLMAVEEYSGSSEAGKFDLFIEAEIRRALALAVDEEESADITGEELAARVNVLQTVSQVLSGELGREATVEELAEKMKMTVEEIKGIMKMAMDAMSMNAESADIEALSGIEGLEILEDEEPVDYNTED